MLTPDDISIADVVTVHSAKPLECPCGCGHTLRGDASHKGIPLCVVAMNLPYVLTRAVNPNGPPVIIDVREVNLMRCQESYWQAFAGGVR